MKKISIGLCLLGTMLVTSCVTKQSAVIEPGVDLNSFNSFHVVRSLIVRQGSERGNSGELIQASLLARSKRATFGKKSDCPKDTEIIVTFEDVWFRDITLYLLEMRIHFTEAATGRKLGSVSSLRGSLTRKEPEVMINEALDRCFPKRRLSAGGES